MIELTAIVATSLAVFGVVPQLWRLVGTGDPAGVSLVAVALGAATEVGWVFYTVQGGLWAAVPESVLMLITNVALARALVRAGTPVGRTLCAAMAWLVLLTSVAFVGGTVALGMLLPLAYAVQVAPAIWCAYRTWSPSGIAAATWVMIGFESALWGAYGVSRHDPAITMLAGIGLAAAASIVLRKVTTRGRGRPTFAVGRHEPLSALPMS